MEDRVTQIEAGDAPSATKQRKGRSATRLKDITKDRIEGKLLPIEFDRNWNPTGEHRTKYVSFVSLLARNKPSITYLTWDAVDDRVKNQIWDTIRV